MVIHGYSWQAGHGMLDIYSALQPITSSSYARSQVYAGSSRIGQLSYDIDSSTVKTSRSFGDALKVGLADHKTYFYDALDGGFAVGVSDLTYSLNPIKPSLSLGTELARLTSVDESLAAFTETGWHGNQGVQKSYFDASVSSNPNALNDFFSQNGGTSLGSASYSMPTLNGVGGGHGWNLGVDMGSGFLTTSFAETAINEDTKADVQSVFLATYQQKISDSLSFAAIIGSADEGSKFLGLDGGGAFDLAGAESKTTLAGVKMRMGFNETYSFGLMAGLSKSELSQRPQGFITGIDAVTADTFAVSFDKFDVWGSDKISLSASQPHRVRSGTMGLRIAGLSNPDGSIPYTHHSIGLTPTGRQIDMSIGYAKDLANAKTLGARLIHTKQAGHVRNASDENSFFIGMRQGNINFGGSYLDSSNLFEAKINYAVQW